MAAPRTLDLFTDAPADADRLVAHGAAFEPPDWKTCAFAAFWVREAERLPEPIDAGLAGELATVQHAARRAGDTAVRGWPRENLAAPSREALHATLRVYTQPNQTEGTSARLGELRTYELVFTRDEPSTCEQPRRHRQLVFSCGPLGFALACPRALAAYANRVATDDLIARFTTTDDADALMEAGELLPILGIHAWTYRLVVASAPLSELEHELLGAEVLHRRRQRIRADAGVVTVLDGACLRHVHRPRVLAQLAWDEARMVAIRGFTHGPHGDGLLPTYVLEPTALGPTGSAIINEDLGEAYERRFA